MESEASEIFYLANYTIKRVELDRNCTFEEFKDWLDKGFIRIGLDEYIRCEEKFYKYHQARIRKTQLQKLRRANNPKPNKPVQQKARERKSRATGKPRLTKLEKERAEYGIPMFNPEEVIAND